MARRKLFNQASLRRCRDGARRLVYTSNIFAMLGLRALYFVVVGMMEKFHYLKVGLSLVLAGVGAKMLLAGECTVPILVSLAL